MLIPPNVLKGISLAASDDTARYQLCGVYLERNGDTPNATATTGKILATATWKEPDPLEYPVPDDGANPTPVPGFTAIVDRNSCVEMAKLPPKRSPKPILENVALEETIVDGTLRAGGTDLDTVRRLDARTVEGTYPDYRIALQTGEPEASVMLDVFQLERACRIVREALAMRKCKDQGPADHAVTLEVNSKGLPVSLKAERRGVKVHVIVMPLTKD